MIGDGAAALERNTADSSVRLAARVRQIGPSPFLAIARAVDEERAAGHDIISLATGEPDFMAPEPARTAGVRAIEEGHTRYTAMDGMPALKVAVQGKLRCENGLDYGIDEITITCGATQIIFNAMMATLEAGDEVVLLAPYFTPYASAVRFAGGVPVVVPCRPEMAFRPDPTAVAAAITTRTRWLVLNSPCNPSGAVLTAENLAAIASIVRAKPDLMVLSDDIYETLVFDGRPFLNLVNVEPGLKHRVLLLNGISKTYGMTGWRIGYAAGPAWLVEAIGQISAISTFTPSAIGQAAAVAALTLGRQAAEMQRGVYQRRRDALMKVLAEADVLACTAPHGAFYAFASCAAQLGRRTCDGRVVESDMDLALYMLRNQGVAVMPGSAFGMPGFLRLSFAAPDSAVVEGARRLLAACRTLH
jgi:aspartate aminotransferase